MIYPCDTTPEVPVDVCQAVNICRQRINTPSAPKQTPEVEAACTAVMAKWNNIITDSRAKTLKQETDRENEIINRVK